MPSFIAGPLTMADIDRMTSTELAWHERNNAENLKAALAPPPPPPPPTAEESLAQQRSAKVKELQPQFEVWLKTQKHDQPGSLTWDLFRRDHAMRIFLEEHNQRKDIEAGVQRFLSAHPEYIVSTSNRKIINDYLGEHQLPPTFANVEKAFQACKGDLTLDQSKVIDPDRPETRAGAWRNKRFYPNDEDTSTGTTRQFAVGQSTPGASDEDVTIRKRPERMTSAEYAEALRVSKTFRAKMDD